MDNIVFLSAAVQEISTAAASRVIWCPFRISTQSAKTPTRLSSLPNAPPVRLDFPRDVPVPLLSLSWRYVLVALASTFSHRRERSSASTNTAALNL